MSTPAVMPLKPTETPAPQHGKGPTLAIDVPHDTVVCRHIEHAPPKSQGGKVIFEANADCEVFFSHPEVFGNLKSMHLKKNTPEPLMVDAEPPAGTFVETAFSLEPYSKSFKTSVKLGDPKIVVP